MSRALHADELHIDADLARSLIHSQLPQFEGFQVVELSSTGSTNKLFKVGNHHLARFPRRPGGSDGILREHLVYTHIGNQLSLPTPKFTGLGQPTSAFPEHWSVMEILPGRRMSAAEFRSLALVQQTQIAVQFAELILNLRALKAPVKLQADSMLQSYRAASLHEFDAHFTTVLNQCMSIRGFEIDFDRASEIWSEALHHSRKETASINWCHGDIVAENLLVDNGRLSALLDFGCAAIGLPSIDLHGAWEVLSRKARSVFRKRTQVSEQEWAVAKGWALAVSLNAIQYYWNKMPDRISDRLIMVNSVLEDQ